MSDAPERIELKVSQLLRLGVLVAAAVIALGMALLVWRGHAEYGASTVAQFRAESAGAVPAHEAATSLARAVAAGDPGGLIQLGILMLMVTPVLRVAATVVVFVMQGDRTMAAIAMVVLLVLVMSATGGAPAH